MFMHVKKNCLSAYGKIFRKGEVVELDDKAGEAILVSGDFEQCYPDTPEKPTRRPSPKRKPKADDLPVPDLEKVVEK